MNIKVNNYALTDEKLNDSKRIANISDVHSNVEALKSIRNILVSFKNVENIEDVLKTIGDNYPTYLSLVNHELFNLVYDWKKKHEEKSNDYLKFFDELKEITKCIPLGFEFESRVFDKSINISAVNLLYDYYLSKKEEDNLIAKLIYLIFINMSLIIINLIWFCFILLMVLWKMVILIDYLVLLVILI